MFRFKQFTIQQDRCAMKVGTDGILLEFARSEWASPLVAENFVVEAEQRHDYTQEFRTLTREFYLRF